MLKLFLISLELLEFSYQMIVFILLRIELFLQVVVERLHDRLNCISVLLMTSIDLQSEVIHALTMRFDVGLQVLAVLNQLIKSRLSKLELPC